MDKDIEQVVLRFDDLASRHRREVSVHSISFMQYKNREFDHEQRVICGGAGDATHHQAQSPSNRSALLEAGIDHSDAFLVGTLRKRERHCGHCLLSALAQSARTTYTADLAGRRIAYLSGG